MKRKAICLIVVSICIFSCSNIKKQANHAYLHNLNLVAFTEEGYPAAWYIEAEPNTVNLSKRPTKDAYKVILTTTSKEAVVMYTPVQLGSECITSLSASTHVKSNPKINASIIFINPSEGRPDMAEPKPGINADDKISHSKKPASNCLGNYFLIGILVKGQGDILIDGFELVVNGQIFEDVQRPEVEISKKNVDEISNKAVLLDDLSVAKPWFENVQVIGLGENSHGAKNLFEMKGKIIKYLIEHQGFTQLSLEMPAITASVINDYIQGRNQDEQKTLYALTYPSWQTQSMMDLLNWLRDYNIKNNNAILFTGFDVQQPRLTISGLEQRFAVNEDGHGVEILKKLSAMLSDENLSPDVFNQQITKLKSHLNTLNSQLSQFAEILQQGAILQNPNLGEGSRSKFMAQQVLHLSQHQKTIIWADNTHISKKLPAMGSWIDERLGQKYMAFGLTFNEGTYSAYGPNNPYQIHPSIKGSHEKIFELTAVDTFLIKLDELPIDHPLLEQREFRFIGSQPQTYSQFHPHRLKEHFDIIGYTGVTSHTEYLIEHDF